MRLISSGGSFLMLHGKAKLVELGGVHFARRIGHQILGGGGFREGDDFANRFFTGEEHHYAVDAEGDAAMRRSAVCQRVEEEAEAVAKLFFREAKRFEEALLDVLAMDSDAAGAELVAVQDEVVAFGADLSATLWLFKQVNVFLKDAGKWVLEQPERRGQIRSKGYRSEEHTSELQSPM